MVWTCACCWQLWLVASSALEVHEQIYVRGLGHMRSYLIVICGVLRDSPGIINMDYPGTLERLLQVYVGFKVHGQFVTGLSFSKMEL